MCDVIFITPNISGTMDNVSQGTLLMATVLKENGVKCEILPVFKIGDLTDFSAFTENAMRIIEEKKPRIVSFYTRCDVYHINIRLAEMIKARWSEIYVVCGGPQSDITAEETIRSIPQIDYVCRGEGELTVYPLFRSLLSGKPDHTVPGLVYRSGTEVCQNPKAPLISDLDTLPWVDYSFLEVENPAEIKVFPIDVGRGCPFGCTFCSTKTFWGRKYRLKSPQRICQEMARIHDMFGITKFSFTHDMFTADHKKVVQTCKLMKELDFNVRWGCSARLDCLNEEMVDVMADSGMAAVYIGIETGSPRMQKLINKKLDVSTALEKVAYLKSKGIKTTASFIYGFPEETEEDLSQTMSLIAKLMQMGTRVQTHLCAFMVGTELTSRYQDQLTPIAYHSDQTDAYGVEECKDLIERNPVLFRQMMEYKTPLRSKLKYFSLFFNVWKMLLPVYQYISETYPEDNLIQMYYDFLDVNRETLESLDDLPEEQWAEEIIKKDCMGEKYVNDEYYGIISDIYRMKRNAYSEEVKNGGSHTDLYCCAPEWEKQYSSIRDYPCCVVSVTYTKDKYETRICDLDMLI